MLALTDAQLTQVHAAAALLRPAARDHFLRAVAGCLRNGVSDRAIADAIAAVFNSLPLASIDCDALLDACANLKE